MATQQWINAGRCAYCIGLSIAALLLAACAQQQTHSLSPTDGQVVTDDGVRLFYREMGEGDGVLVAPVGFYLEPYLLEALAKNRRVIMYDPRNRGRSEAASLEFVSLERQLQDLENLRVALEIEDMDLLGWSGLGMEMAVYAMRHPERVRRLIQISPIPPAASIFQEAGDGRQNAIDADALAALDKRAAEGAFEDAPEEHCRLYNEITTPSNFADLSYASALVDVCQYENEHPENLWPYFSAFLPSLGDFDWRDQMSDLTMPRLVIHGREDGVPLIGGEAWVAGQENARIVVLSPAGHFPFIEQKQATIDAIDSFLNGNWPDNAERR